VGSTAADTRLRASFTFPVVDLQKVVERPEAACARESKRSQLSMSRLKRSGTHMCNLDRFGDGSDTTMQDYVRL